MTPLKYPIGIQTFEEIVKDGWAYADKTAYVYQLATTTKQVFLSRPRRFGKSLLLSTLQAYFEGKKELFEGLALGRLETEWQSYPVLHFSFGAIEAEDASKIENSVHLMLRAYERKYGVAINDDALSFGARFGALIQNVAEKTGKKVVVLIDEYDKGIVNILQNENQLAKNISLFRSFYAQLKDQDRYLRFVFLTGVSRFRHLTFSSSLNHLYDISLDAKYAAICGFTSEELATVFAPGIEDLAAKEELTVDDAKEKLRQMYAGYRFSWKDIQVYNPVSILNCLRRGRFRNYWIATGCEAKVLRDYIDASDYSLSQIEEMWVSETTLNGSYSKSDPIPLLFQTGYLTIADYDDYMYRMKIPNGEVQSALHAG